MNAGVKVLGYLGLLCLLNLPAQAAVWKASGDIGFAHFEAELRDGKDPVVVFIRIENNSTVESLKIGSDFVQITDAHNERVRPVDADEVVSVHLEHIRQLLPRYALEIDKLLGGIRADYPQQKIVEVYGSLKDYMQQGKPTTWRTELENFLLSKPASTEEDAIQTNRVIEEIGQLSQNYLWPTDVAPKGNCTGVLFFRKPTQLPVNIFFHIGKDFIGTQMQIVSGDEKKAER